MRPFLSISLGLCLIALSAYAIEDKVDNDGDHSERNLEKRYAGFFPRYYQPWRPHYYNSWRPYWRGKRDVEQQSKPQTEAKITANLESTGAHNMEPQVHDNLELTAGDHSEHNLEKRYANFFPGYYPHYRPYPNYWPRRPDFRRWRRDVDAVSNVQDNVEVAGEHPEHNIEKRYAGFYPYQPYPYYPRYPYRHYWW